jgi:hypothetical protein
MTKKRSKRARSEVEAKAEQPANSAREKAGKVVVSSSHSLINRKFADKGTKAEEMKCTEQLYPSLTYGEQLPAIPESPPAIDPSVDALCDAEVAEICGKFGNMNM